MTKKGNLGIDTEDIAVQDMSNRFVKELSTSKQVELFITVCIVEGISIRERLPNKIRQFLLTGEEKDDDSITKQFVLNGLVSQGYDHTKNEWFHYPQLKVTASDGSLTDTISRCWE